MKLRAELREHPRYTHVEIVGDELLQFARDGHGGVTDTWHLTLADAKDCASQLGVREVDWETIE